MTDRQPPLIVSRNFVIPAGTQVVLQTTKATGLEPDAVKKKPGSVGVVTKCPPHNDQPYTIQFADGSVVEASFDELSLRRQEIDNLLLSKNHETYRPFVIYRCQVGSKAFGLSNESSDDDIRGIFLPPAELHWSLYEVPQQLEFNDGQLDEVFWELEKFLRLALKANPNILETLWTPMVLEASPIAIRLREMREAFLSRHIFKTYSGYALSQFRRMRNSFQKNGTYKSKHAMHLIRLLHSGSGALKTGEIMVDVSEFRSELLAIRNGQYSFEQIESMAIELNKTFADAFEHTKLPEQPNFKTVDQFLIEARESAISSRPK
ncbi:nucleotidyltransferase domain-containing protein [Mariniblastus fucicola]|uniref:Putative nucleotidyltransferase n=1 Tax=Mariniblastus fucicola TaxID=980251 RepID=A0A5B9P8Y5_9BACT|nr:nucleotidyltransferase domain-containing protein [Mariniblastus fucicola]QEG21685.1 putative nucleotidyltransferase [Mariniblastus fucicola]